MTGSYRTFKESARERVTGAVLKAMDDGLDDLKSFVLVQYTSPNEALLVVPNLSDMDMIEMHRLYQAFDIHGPVEHIGIVLPDTPDLSIRAIYSSYKVREAEIASIVAVSGMPPLIGDWEPTDVPHDEPLQYLLSIAD